MFPGLVLFEDNMLPGESTLHWKFGPLLAFLCGLP